MTSCTKRRSTNASLLDNSSGIKRHKKNIIQKLRAREQGTSFIPLPHIGQELKYCKDYITELINDYLFEFDIEMRCSPFYENSIDCHRGTEHDHLSENEYQEELTRWLNSWDEWTYGNGPLELIGERVICLCSKAYLTEEQIAASRKYASKQMPYVPSKEEIAGDTDVMNWLERHDTQRDDAQKERILYLNPEQIYAGKVTAFNIIAHIDDEHTSFAAKRHHIEPFDNRVVYLMLELQCTHKLSVGRDTDCSAGNASWTELVAPTVRYSPCFAVMSDIYSRKEVLWRFFHVDMAGRQPHNNTFWAMNLVRECHSFFEDYE